MTGVRCPKVKAGARFICEYPLPPSKNITVKIWPHNIDININTIVINI